MNGHADDIDLYEVLDVAKDASTDDIRSAYRKQALKTHPDRALPERKEESTARFKLVGEAYAVLSDPGRRRTYDNQRESGSGFGPDADSSHMRDDFGGGFGAGFGGFGPSSPFGGPFGYGQHDPFAMFDSMFGGSFGGHNRPRPGPNHWPQSPFDSFFGQQPFGFGFGFGMGPPAFAPFAQQQQQQQQYMREAAPSSPIDVRGLSADDAIDIRSPELQPQRESFSRSFSSSSSSSFAGAGQTSQQTYTVNDNGNMQTVTRQVAADGTETVYRRDANGEQVTVNGVPQANHPLLQGGMHGQGRRIPIS